MPPDSATLSTNPERNPVYVEEYLRKIIVCWSVKKVSH